jgi:hypothetical protein
MGDGATGPLSEAGRPDSTQGGIRLTTKTELVQRVVDSYTEPGDQDKFSHYSKKDDIAKAYIDGVPIIALCGKVWIPTRDPEKFPVCPQCKDIFDNTKWADD